MTASDRLRRALPWLLLVAALAFPWIAAALDQSFYVGVMRRVLIFAIAAASLNLLLGYGGMVSLGHAAFFGVGAYAAAVLAVEGVSSAWLAWPVAVAVAAPGVLPDHLEARLDHPPGHPVLGHVGDRQHGRVPPRVHPDGLAGRVLLVLAGRAARPSRQISFRAHLAGVLHANPLAFSRSAGARISAQISRDVLAGNG